MILINNANKDNFKQVRIVENNGETTNLITSIDRAITMADQSGLDLIIVNDKTSPFVSKIADYGKLKFEKSKFQKEQKKKQHVVSLKEFQLRVVTGINDIQIKAKKAKTLLNEGNKIKVVVRLKGREQQTPQLGKDVINTFLENVGDYDYDTNLQTSGRDMFVILKQKKENS